MAGSESVAVDVGAIAGKVGAEIPDGFGLLLDVGGKTFNVATKTFNVADKTFDVGAETFDVGNLTFDVFAAKSVVKTLIFSMLCLTTRKLVKKRQFPAISQAGLLPNSLG